MKTIGWSLLLLLGVGCSTHRLAVVPPRPDGVHYPAIYAAGLVKPSPDRALMLASLAGRPDLTAGEQMYLVDVLEASGGTSNQKALVLLELLRNPSTNNFTRSKIGERLAYMDLQRRHAEEIAAAMSCLW